VTSTQPEVIERNVEKTNAWLKDLAAELGTDDRHYAYRVLRAFFHVLRDRLTVNESAQLAAQLPELLRGVYYEGWRPSDTPAGYRHADEFEARIAREAKLGGSTEASFAVTAAMTVLRGHVSGGEIADVLSVLPADISVLLSQ
jgi:uncharacterized protein (DUF2267 family)